MSRPAQSQIYYCPYCSVGGWTKSGEVVAHVKKSHGIKVKSKHCTVRRELRAASKD